MKSSDDLTREQLAQMDFVDNTIFNMLKEVTGCPDLEWDIRIISEIRDSIIEEYYPDEDDEFKFYPFFVEEEEENFDPEDNFLEEDLRSEYGYG